MEGFYAKCVFCLADLPEYRGQGDHMIPGYLGGSIRFKDVCTKCNNKNGELEARAIEDPYIIQAVKHLGLTDLEKKIKDKAKVTFISEDGEELPGSSRGGIPKIVPRQVSKELLEKSTPDALSQLLKQYPSHEESIKRTFELMGQSDSGLFFPVPGIPITLRTVTSKVRYEYTVSSKAVLPLVAKIAYEMSMHFIIGPDKRQPIIPYLERIRDYLLCGSNELESDPTILCHHPEFRPDEFDVTNCRRYHQISISVQPYGYAFDIIFFSAIAYRMNFLCETFPIHSQDGDFQSISYLMSFEGETPKKFIAIHGVEEEAPRVFNADLL